MNFNTQYLIKKPNIFFLIAIAVAILWIAVIGIFFLPKIGGKLIKTVDHSKQIRDLCIEIHELDPARLDYAKARSESGKFDFTREVNKITKSNGISNSSFHLKTSKPRKSAGVLIQSVNLTIDPVSIEKLSKFISEMLNTWPDLKCDLVTLRAVTEEPDVWKVTLKLTYAFERGK